MPTSQPPGSNSGTAPATPAPRGAPRARRGKIACLPRLVREELNMRLDNGEPTGSLLVWLNKHPKVLAVLGKHFGNHSINEQNLSEWRRGGFQDWLNEQDILDHGGNIADLAESLQELLGGGTLPERYCTLMVVELAKVMQLNSTPIDDPDLEDRRVARLVSLTNAMVKLRKVEIEAENARLKHERSQAQLDLQRQRLELVHQQAARKEEQLQINRQLVKDMALANSLLNSFNKPPFADQGTGQTHVPKHPPPTPSGAYSAPPPEYHPAAAA